MTKPNLLVSFSGGRTSAYMLYWIWKHLRGEYKSIVGVFANTGKEAEGTLRFVQDCCDYWGLYINWVEYSPRTGKGWGVIPKHVNYKTASRKGEPFEAMISHLGIPSSAAPFCTTVLKQRTIKAYARDVLGWKDYYTAIGIRADEMDRVNPKFKEDRIIYPLIKSADWPCIGVDIEKLDVMAFWERQVFDLEIHPDEGNCDNCWKKNLNLLVRNAARNPDSYNWWREMEIKYDQFNPRPSNNTVPPYRFYRGNLSVDDILFLRDHVSKEVIEQLAIDNKLNGCGESCEAF